MKWLLRFLSSKTQESIAPSVVSDGDQLSAKPNDPHQYNSDQPITNRSEDRFNRGSFASRIADTIASRADPSSIVIGLYGPWGDGKTSVLEMMDEALKEYSHVISVRFNPWLFQSEELLLRGFFSTLAEALGRSLPTKKEKVGETLQRYGDLLSLASVDVAGVVKISAGQAAKGIGASLSTVSLDELKRRLESILAESGKRVAILIDDIDRLDREETHAIFKLVKLSASFRHTSYVMAFDDVVVSAALGERYGEGGQEAGRAFLEKIIQVPLHLPPADEIALRQLAFEGVQLALAQAGIELTQKQVDAYVRHFVDGLEQRLTTPRLAKLYVNAVTFVLPLLKGEVDSAELMLIEGVRVFYPKLYAEIRDNPDLFLKGSRQNVYGVFDGKQPDQVETLLMRGMPGSTEEERQRIRKGLIEALFPRLRMNYGHEWEREWGNKQKICSSQYFRRYFTYGVPDGDVADTEIRALIGSLANAGTGEQRRILEEYGTRRAIPRLIGKLRDAADGMAEDEAEAVLFALVCNAGVLPRERGPMVMGGTWMEGGILASQLLRRLPFGNSRQQAAEKAAQIAEPLNFCWEYLRWISHSEERSEDRRVLTDEGEVAIRGILANRVQDAESQSPLYLTFGRDAPALYWLWAKQDGTEAVKEALLKRFEASPADVDAFLDCYIGEGWEIESGLPIRSELRRDRYDWISELVPPEYIAANLLRRFGDELRSPSYYSDDSMPFPRRVAHQFIYIHYAAQEKANSTADQFENGKEEPIA